MEEDDFGGRKENENVNKIQQADRLTRKKVHDEIYLGTNGTCFA